MEFIESIYNVIPEFLWELISLAGKVCAILFIHFSGKYRNAKLEIKWYILAFFFPLITAVVYLSKRKRYKKIEYKVCGNCGDLYPQNYEICTRCLAELPDFEPKKKVQQKTLATVFLCLFFFVYIFDFVSGFVVVSDVLNSFGQAVTAESRIGFEDSEGNFVYYDRNGEEYYDELDLIIYDREGNMYYYTYDGGIDCFYKDDGEVSIWEEDDVIPVYNLLVDAEGYMVDVSDRDDITLIIDESTEYQYYFDAPYTDEEGNLYYSPMYASWNEKGELITSAEQVE